MKCLIVFVLVAVVAVSSARHLTEEQIAKLEPISKECRAISGATEEMIQKMRKGEFSNDEKEKKQMLCVMKKTGVMTESGDFVMDTIKEKLKKTSMTEEKMEEIMKKCCIKKDDPEETAYHAVTCITEEKDTFSPAD